MAGITSIVALIAQKRTLELDLFAQKGEDIQREQLKALLTRAQETEYGCKYGFSSIKSVNDFQSQVPIVDYDDLKPFIERMVTGEENVLWPDLVKWFAKSSGTTNDKSKFIPVSDEGLQVCHYQGGKDAVVLYLKHNPDSNLLAGLTLTLGGSCKLTSESKKTTTGDLSAIMISNTPWYANWKRSPGKEEALMTEWEAKLEKISEVTMKQNITAFAGVPSWLMVLLKKVMEKANTNNILDVWPNLELFIHGGISFSPYKDQYKKIIPSAAMSYIETYNASEGFFAVQDQLGEQGMLLMLDYGIFYEFIPMNMLHTDSPKTLSLWEVQLDVNYAMLITTNSGLWRYMIGDTVKFVSLHPHRIVITGRTKHFINAFGEELMVGNAEKGLEIACHETGAIVSNYTAAPVFMTDKSKGRHQWLIEFEQLPPNLDQFVSILDKALQSLNSDYEAKRYKNITLEQLEIVVLKQGTFYEWLKSKSKLGGQNKVPRLSNDRQYVDAILKF